ncbi:unnamed protein product [Mytilus coruscus]|uniref:Uncharacterized protein n=1 Tax=Mytilus coruscus TaxID=42192 RepID=A0A6J8BFS9_MYTCO|nr:unnamed protein product [Mytilus coruscus]
MRLHLERAETNGDNTGATNRRKRQIQIDCLSLGIVTKQIVAQAARATKLGSREAIAVVEDAPVNVATGSFEVSQQDQNVRDRKALKSPSDLHSLEGVSNKKATWISSDESFFLTEEEGISPERSKTEEECDNPKRTPPPLFALHREKAVSNVDITEDQKHAIFNRLLQEQSRFGDKIKQQQKQQEKMMKRSDRHLQQIQQKISKHITRSMSLKDRKTSVIQEDQTVMSEKPLSVTDELGIKDSVRSAMLN